MNRTSALLLACGLAAVTGCRTSPPPATIRAHDAGFGAPESFSDERSRDWVRQTRQLLELRNRDYLVGPDDVLEISIFEWETGDETKTLQFRVAESGGIALPSIGVISVADRSVQEIQKIIEHELEAKNVLQNPRVGVSVEEFRSRRIAVVGQVNAPGVYAIHQNVSTLMDVLTLAGGPSDNAGQVAQILRTGKGSTPSVRIAVDLEELLDRGNFELNAVLQGGDVVHVPKAPLIYVYGRVRQPGGFSLNRSMRTMEAIALAGGFAEKANRKECMLTRASRTGPLVYGLNLADIESGREPDLYLKDGDVLSVPESMSKLVATELWDVFRGIFTFTYRLDNAQ